MAKYEVNMPKFGATMEDGEIVEWYKNVGDPVKKGDKLCSIMTEKLTNDLEAMHDGTLTEINTQDGEKANCGDIIGYIED